MPFKVVMILMVLHPSCRMCHKRPFFMIVNTREEASTWRWFGCAPRLTAPAGADYKTQRFREVRA
jgi:hypothetical protein